MIEQGGNRVYGISMPGAGFRPEISMKKVYASPDCTQIEIVGQLLRDEGIESRVFNEQTSAVLGDIPFFRAFPEIWVRKEDESSAKAVVARFESGQVRDERKSEPWTCPECSQSIEGQFTECWSCTVDDPRDDLESRCLECGYLLRELPERRCPECGTKF